MLLLSFVSNLVDEFSLLDRGRCWYFESCCSDFIFIQTEEILNVNDNNFELICFDRMKNIHKVLILFRRFVVAVLDILSPILLA